MSNIMPEPNGQRCVYCGQPIQNHEACVASKPKRSKVWVFIFSTLSMIFATPRIKMQKPPRCRIIVGIFAILA